MTAVDLDVCCQQELQPYGRVEEGHDIDLSKVSLDITPLSASRPAPKSRAGARHRERQRNAAAAAAPVAAAASGAAAAAAALAGSAHRSTLSGASRNPTATRAEYSRDGHAYTSVAAPAVSASGGELASTTGAGAVDMPVHASQPPTGDAFQNGSAASASQPQTAVRPSTLATTTTGPVRRRKLVESDEDSSTDEDGAAGSAAENGRLTTGHVQPPAKRPATLKDASGPSMSVLLKDLSGKQAWSVRY